MQHTLTPAVNVIYANLKHAFTFCERSWTLRISNRIARRSLVSFPVFATFELRRSRSKDASRPTFRSAPFSDPCCTPDKKKKETHTHTRGFDTIQVKVTHQRFSYNDSSWIIFNWEQSNIFVVYGFVKEMVPDEVNTKKVVLKLVSRFQSRLFFFYRFNIFGADWILFDILRLKVLRKKVFEKCVCILRGTLNCFVKHVHHLRLHSKRSLRVFRLKYFRNFAFFFTSFPNICVRRTDLSERKYTISIRKISMTLKSQVIVILGHPLFIAIFHHYFYHYILRTV